MSSRIVRPQAQGSVGERRDVADRVVQQHRRAVPRFEDSAPGVAGANVAAVVADDAHVTQVLVQVEAGARSQKNPILNDSTAL